MTSASELFYQRRSRVGRATPDLGFDPSSSSDRNSSYNHNRRHQNHHHNHNRDRRELDGCDHPFRRYPHVRHPCHSRLSAFSDRSSVRLDQGTSHFTPSTSIGAESLISTRSSRNERLPGAVLLARARLLERLRGVSISSDRQSDRASFDNREYIFGDDLRVTDAGDWGTERRESSKEKPPGLTPEALNCLQSEVFRSLEKGAEGEVSQVSWDCSICLESFTEGDELIRLPCEHRFHATCLDPWVRTCGDCPYCRRDIVVSRNNINRT